MNGLTLTSAQNRAVQSATNATNMQAPTAIAGPAGSGKTLVATEIASIFASQTAMDVFSTGSQQSVYFVTYTNELVRFVNAQLEEVLGKGQESVTVLTVHMYLKTFLLKNNFGNFYFHNKFTRARGIKSRKGFLEDYLANKKDDGFTGPLANASFLDEEIGWLLGQGIRSPQKYLAMSRTGRRTRLNKQQREKVFQAYRDYMAYLKSEGDRIGKKIIDYDDIGNQVTYYCDHHYFAPIASHLIIDEVQDLAKTWIDALRKTTGGKTVFAGDPTQSIYGRGFTWRDVTGQRVRPIHLTEDFRITQQIYRAARSLMDFDQNSENEAGRVEQRRRNGDKPTLVFCKDQDSQTQRISELVANLKRDNPKCIIAVAAPKRENVRAIKECCLGVLATTLHSLKGLEADHVILANLDEDSFDFTNEYTQEDTNRHLLYVGMTRARQTLTMMTSTDRPSPVLLELSAECINIDDTENPAAHRALIEMRDSRARESRSSFEQLVKEKVESEEAVEQAKHELQVASNTSPSGSSDRELIAQLKRKLKEQQQQLQKSEEKLSRQEDELRVYRAREMSDSAAPAGAESYESQRPQFFDNAKILILGGLGVKPKDIPGIFKSVGLSRDAFLHLDYDDVHSGKFDASQLLYTSEYSDIFVSTTPHSVKGIGSASSLAEYLEENERHLPKLKIFKDVDGVLKKTSKTDLKEALYESALYKAKMGI